jgi:hypothetical protein
MARDRVVKNMHPAFSGPGVLSFINQDEGRNARTLKEPVQSWVMLLGIPQQLINKESIKAIIKSFRGVLLFWHEPAHNTAKVIVKCLVEDLDHIPRDISYGNFFSRNGFRRSWTIIAYPLVNDVQPTPMPPSEDLPPDNIDAHPYQGLIFPEHPVDAAWNEFCSAGGSSPFFQSAPVSPADKPATPEVVCTTPAPTLEVVPASDAALHRSDVSHSDNLFKNADDLECSEPIDLAMAAQDLKRDGYTELEILATLDEVKRSGRPYVPGSPPWMPSLLSTFLKLSKI